MTGYVYGVWHPEAPCAEDGAIRVKIGRSRHDPWRDSLDGRVRKLNLSLQAFGWEPVKDAFPVLQTAAYVEVEKALHRKAGERGTRLRGLGKRQLTEIFLIKREELDAAVAEVRREYGI